MLTVVGLDRCGCGAVIGWEEEDLGACRECGAPVELADSAEARETQGARKPNPFARCADFGAALSVVPAVDERSEDR